MHCFFKRLRAFGDTFRHRYQATTWTSLHAHVVCKFCVAITHRRSTRISLTPTKARVSHVATRQGIYFHAAALLSAGILLGLLSILRPFAGLKFLKCKVVLVREDRISSRQIDEGNGVTCGSMPFATGRAGCGLVHVSVTACSSALKFSWCIAFLSAYAPSVTHLDTAIRRQLGLPSMRMWSVNFVWQ